MNNITFSSSSSLKNLNKKFHQYFLQLKYQWKNIILLKEIVITLNKKWILIVSWLISASKTELIHEIIKKTNKLNHFFYINTHIDIYKSIYSSDILEEIYNNEPIIILENIWQIENIDTFIHKYNKNWKKIIIIWNDYNPKWIHTIEILPEYDSLHCINLLQYNQKNSIYINLLSHKIITQEIIIQNNVKNIHQIQAIIYFLTQNIDFISIREINILLHSKWIKIAHITLIEYINYIISSKLIKKVFRYDIKKELTSSWKNNFISTGKAKYFFTDSEILYALSWWNIDFFSLAENIIFQKLEQMPVSIYSWKNWTFNWSFLTKDCWIEKNPHLIIQISRNIEKGEVKKEAKKLLKIPWKYTKFLLVKSIKDIGIRPSTYLPLQIMDIQDFIQNL